MRDLLSRDYYALALEWLKYARESIERNDIRLPTDAGYNAAELVVKALIVGKGETLAKSHGGMLDQFGRLYIPTGRRTETWEGSHIKP
ncbi:MAG: hypothetical protein AOA65_1668 [Candidatus Bathyarchaeota archaeon BA1]|nr:MAG: hypothetical protein AOA65_1668 [Candidatus Bathyarchaeota archaeon BA1]